MGAALLALGLLAASWMTSPATASAPAATQRAQLSADSLPPLPTALAQPYVVALDEALIVAGGLADGGAGDPRAEIHLLTATDATTWQDAGRLDGPAARGASAAGGDAATLIGGLGADGPLRRVVRLRRVDGALLSEPLLDLPAPRLDAVAAILDGTLYVSGGRNAPDGRPAADLWALDLDDPSAAWRVLEPCPGGARTGAALVARAGALYLLGGAGSDGANWSYRPTPFDGTRERGWIRVAPAPADLTEVVAVATGQSHITAWTAAGQALAYHTVTDTWVSLGPLPEAAGEDRLGAAWGGGTVLLSAGGSPSAPRLVTVTGQPASLHAWDWIAIGLYLVVLIAIGGYFANKERTSADFFLGGRRIPWWAAGISLYATGTSAISFMAIPTKTYVTNQVYGLGSLWSPIFWIPAAFVIIPLIRSLDLTSTYEYLERRFSIWVRLLGSLLCVAFQVGGRMSVILLLPAMALSAVTGMDVMLSVGLMGVLATVYTVMGGIQAVIWTDVLQCVVLIGGGVAAFAIMVFGLDSNWASFVALNTDYGKFDALLTGWDWTVPVFWIFALSSLMQLATFPNDQVMVQRVLATPSPKAARNSAIVLALIVVPGTILFHGLGSALFAHFRAHPERLSPTMENIHTLPLFIVQSMPVGVTGLVIAGLFAASMSSLDSSMSSTATVLVTDFYKRFRSQATDASCLRLARWLTAIVGLLGTAVALLMATYEIKSLYDMWMQLVALLGGGFAGVYGLGMLTKRANDTGAIVGAVVSVVVTVLVKAYTPLHFMLYGVVSVGTCIGVGYLASLMLPGRVGALEGLTVYTRDRG